MLLFNDLIISSLLAICFCLESKLNSLRVKYFLWMFISLIEASIYLKLLVFTFVKFVFIWSNLALILSSSFWLVKSLHNSFIADCSSVSYYNYANISLNLDSKSFYLVLIVYDCIKIIIFSDFMKTKTAFMST